jgi:hypothetical protein
MNAITACLSSTKREMDTDYNSMFSPEPQYSLEHGDKLASMHKNHAEIYLKIAQEAGLEESGFGLKIKSREEFNNFLLL